MKTIIRFILVSSFVLPQISIAQWKPVSGPLGLCASDVICLSQPSGDSIILLAAGKIFRSTNDGELWLPTDGSLQGLGAKHFAVVDRSGSTPIVFAGYDNLGSQGNSLFASTDYGSSWSPVTTPSATRVLSLHAFPRAGNSTALFVGSLGDLYVSYDLGVTWITANSMLPNAEPVITDMVECSGKICAAVQDWGGGGRAGVFVTNDDGKSWTSAGSEIYQPTGIVSLVNNNGNTILVAGSVYNGIYRSTNLGGSWTNVKKGPVWSLNIVDNDIYAGFDANYPLVHDSLSLFRSTDFGQTWFAACTGLPDYDCRPGVIRRQSNGTSADKIFAACASGVYFSTDRGSHWYSANNGFSPYWDITAFGTKGKILVLGHGWMDLSGYLGSGFITTDGGKQWKDIVQKPLSAVAFDGTDILTSTAIDYDGRAHLGGKLYKSLDSGYTWTNLADAPHVNSIYAHDGFYWASNDLGVCVSTNSGVTWEYRNRGLSDSMASCFAWVHANNSEHLFSGTRKGVFVSSDRGMNWLPTGSGPKDVSSMATTVSLQGAPYLFAGTENAGVFVSSDRGSLWTSINSGLKNQHVLKIVTYDKYTFCALGDSISNGGGVYLSGDFGITWKLVTAGLPADIIAGIGVGDSLLYVATISKGLWCTPISIMTSAPDVNSNNAPNSFVLHQNYPNPFNPSTTIEYSIPQQSQVTVKIFDLLGREVAVLVNGRKESGRYSVQWNAAAMPSGIYFYRIEAAGYSATKKLILLK
ncbi:MAG: T9SS type A sorting domain-containing protein [Ignavibacteriales bacterium]|nr:T9SS type A sorting domain-containing protein [Ignavibacteriales bacterium]